MGLEWEVDKQDWEIVGTQGARDPSRLPPPGWPTQKRTDSTDQDVMGDAMRKTSGRMIRLAGFASLGLMNAVSAFGALPFTQAWYAERAGDPPGARQIDSHGKLWPPYPRPVGRKQTKLHSFHYSHYWPYPHNCEDEAFTRGIIGLQSANGWTSATTLHEYHFNPENQQLTEEGRAHLLWVSHSVPPQYRTVYVAEGASREIAQLRLQNSELYLKETGIPNPPPVVAQAEVFAGRPAVEVDRIRQLELMSIPRPRLFYIGSATAAGGGGGGAMGGVPGNTGGPNGGVGSSTTTPGR